MAQSDLLAGFQCLLAEACDVADSLLLATAKDFQEDEVLKYGERWDHKMMHPDKTPLETMDVDELSDKLASAVISYRAALPRVVEGSSASAVNTSITAKGELVCHDIDALYGTYLFRTVLNRIQSYSNKPSVFQWQFIFHAMHAMLPFFFSGLTPTTLPVPDQASDWTRYKFQICDHLGFNGLPPDLGCAASTPRQFGKTTSQAMLMAALLADVPGVTLISVSTGARVSEWVSKAVRRFLAEMGTDVTQRYAKHDMEVTELRPRNVDPSVRDSPMNSKLYSLPSNAEKLRGLSATFIFADETAFLNSELLTQFVLPLLGVNYRKLFAISTPSTQRRSFFGSIISDGKDIGFNILVIEGMCKECAAKSASECPHRASVATPWTSVVNQGRLRQVYELVSRDSYNREMLGGTVDATVSAFRPDSVNRVFQDPLARFKIADYRHWAPRCVFMAIDPSGLGERSDFAIVSFFFTEHGELVVSVCYFWIAGLLIDSSSVSASSLICGQLVLCCFSSAWESGTLPMR